MIKSPETGTIVNMADFQRPAEPLPKGVTVVAGGEWIEAQREETVAPKEAPVAYEVGGSQDPSVLERRRLMANGFI